MHLVIFNRGLDNAIQEMLCTIICSENKSLSRIYCKIQFIKHIFDYTNWTSTLAKCKVMRSIVGFRCFSSKKSIFSTTQVDNYDRWGCRICRYKFCINCTGSLKLGGTSDPALCREYSLFIDLAWCVLSNPYSECAKT